ncbi:hypothetical protein GCM10011376_15040 [Nocardioides flavus (ex Wang et al. 2016)]|uniref:Secreted protein n=1 Tax=Nocardioides flavus (ex Wang et al. 2016) TaxID=2058780 RepID=A0ABQ3HL64_9ACTN|nr:DUF5719 family protein [Nocardioides flavus (ex Wang et al. 2016)]GHE16894.1 hypothetical protein GCM10011376_15040 [Nocardioides flavus (ex Wang et al. 2016)]
MTEPESTTGVGRRRVAETSRGRPSPLTVLAVVIPLLTVAALALVRPADESPTSYAPTEAPLDRATAVCPPRLPGADEVRLGSSSLASGDLALRVGREEDVESLADGVAARTERQYVVVGADGELAPGLVVSRSGGGSAVGCEPPSPERWFTGVGASAEHASTLTLVNPDKGPAVADVTVWDGSGVVDVPALRGVRVPGGRSTSFDLSTVSPNRDALAIRVAVTRGRLASSVVDVIDPVGRDAPVREWLPAQAAPAATSYVAGVGTSSADRVLTLANPGDSEVRVVLKLVSEESEFVPSGLEEVTLAPASVREVELSGVLRGPALQGVQGIRVEATAPVTASLRTRTARDLALSAAGESVSEEAAVALPGGSKRLVLVGADAPGVVTLRAWDADGAPVVRERRVEVDPATAARLRLPDDAVLAVLGVERTGVVAALEVVDRGLSVLPLSQLVATSPVPDVRPAQR